MSAGAGEKKRVLIIGGTRFSGLYLWKELHDRVCIYMAGLVGFGVVGVVHLEGRQACTHTVSPDPQNPKHPSTTPKSQGYDITVFNRGKTPNRAVPGESQAAFEERVGKAKFVTGDRTNADVSDSPFF